MTVAQLYQKLDTAISPSLSCEWDNDGLMCCPDPDKEVKQILLVLDINEKAIDYAIEKDFDVILSHHPLIFKPIGSLDPQNAVARKLIRLVQSGIAAMSFHTRFDALDGGVNDVLADLLGLSEPLPFGPEGEKMGRIGYVSPCSLTEFAEKAKKALGTPMVLCCGDREVRRVAILGGNGDDFIFAAKEAGADTYLSGRLGYHPLSEATQIGINLIEAGHFYTEAPALNALARIVHTISPEIMCSVKEEIEIFSV